MSKIKFLKPGEERLINEESLTICESGSDGYQSKEICSFLTTNSYDSVENQRKNLPIYQIRDQFLYALETNRVVIVCGDTGCGKSTQIPQFIYESGWLAKVNGIMAVTQPRRVATITLASRIADEKGWKMGSQIGYHIRFENLTSEKTVIRFFTDGMLIQEMMNDPLLSKYRIIMIDEVHERGINSDILIGLLKKVLKRRPFDLRIIIASATIQAEVFFEYFNDLEFKTDEDTSLLNNVTYVSAQGRQYPIRIYYSIDPVPCYIRASLETVFKIHENKPPGGDILVFLTGQEDVHNLVSLVIQEYRDRKEKAISSNRNRNKVRPSDIYQPLKVSPFYSSLGQNDQLKVFDKSTKYCRKVVVATNVAETSITIPGIIYVIDSGFTRMRAYNSYNGLECLVTMQISQASADQRAGRAGRQRPGEVYRLYSEDDFKMFPFYTTPESMRIDLSSVLLRLKTLGIDNLADFDWLPPKPPLEHLGRSAERLVALGALESSKGKLNLDKGNLLAEILSSCGFSDPGCAAALLGSLEEGCTKQVASVLALIQMQQVFISVQGHLKTGDKQRRLNFGCRQGDHLTMLNAFTAFENIINDPSYDLKGVQKWCDENSLNFKTLSHALKFRENIQKVLKRLKIPWIDVEPPGNPDPILRSLLRGYFTYLAKLDSRTGNYRTIRGNHELRVHPSSIYYSSSDNRGFPDYIIFSRVLLGGTYEDRYLFKNSDTVATYISEISSVQPEWIRELIHHYYSYGTDREQIENSLKPSTF